MNLESEIVACPYCGERIELLVEALDERQGYYEDCQVCCQPIYIELTPAEPGSKPNLRCLRSDETP